MNFFDFTFKLGGHEYRNCFFHTGYYNGGNLSLAVYDEEGCVCTCSVNAGRVPPRSLAVKNYSENEGMVDALKELGIIGAQIDSIESGWVKIPVFSLAPDGLKLFGFED